MIRRTLLIVIALAIAGCTSTSASPGGAQSATPGTNTPDSAGPAAAGTGPGAASGAHPAAAWPTFDVNAARTGVATGVRPAGALGIRWSAHLDGAVYGQPLVVGDMVIAATENDTVYALDSSTGKTVWSRHLGTPVPQGDQHGCGDIFPLGITGTPVYDQSDGIVYAVAEETGYAFVLYGLSVSDGTVRVDRPISLATGHNQPGYDQQRPALTIDDGRVYASFGGLAGDCGPYVGSVVGIPLSGKGSQVSFSTPTTREGAVWGTGGPVVAPDGDMWISIGNGAAESPGDTYDGSDSVTELTPGLLRAGFFAPSTWADDNANDLDLGSTQPVLAAGNSAFIVGKRGVGYLLSSTSLGGVGSQLASLPVCKAFGAAAVSGSVIYEPCNGGPITAVSVSAASRQIRVLWRGPSGTNGSPVAGGGAVWVTEYGKSGNGTLYELDPATGKARYSIPLDAPLPHFSSLSVAGSSAYVSTLDGVTAISGA